MGDGVTVKVGVGCFGGLNINFLDEKGGTGTMVVTGVAGWGAAFTDYREVMTAKILWW